MDILQGIRFLSAFALKVREMAHPLLLRDYHSQVQTQLCSCYLWVYQPTSPCPTLFCSCKTNLPRRLLEVA